MTDDSTDPASPHARFAPGTPTRLAGHVLLADDSATVRMLMEEYLRRTGLTVTGVDDGAQATACVRESLQQPGSRTLHLILLDLHMPGISGLETARRIRALGYAGPIVLMTADSAQEADWAQAGCDAMALKPVDLPSFIPLITRLIAAGPR